MLDVYRTYYKMTGEPFRLSPDHRFSLAHNSYANAKSYLEYAIFQGEGFIAVTGGPGTGKTTLISDLIEGLDKEKIVVATLTSTQLESRDLLQMVVNLFDLRPEDMSKPGLLLEMEQFLNKQHHKGRRVILIVDEAQGLSTSALEELRLLANLQRNHQLLLQVFLVGQEQLLELLRAPGMEQLHQRLIAASHLKALELDEVIDYIEHRLSRVGWKGDPKIDEGALRLIYRYSGGIPRRINLICNRLFLYGGLEQKHELVVEDARVVIEDLHKEFLLSHESTDEIEQEEIAEPTGDARTPVRSLPRRDMNAAPAKAPDEPSSTESGKESAEKVSPQVSRRPASAKPAPDKAHRTSSPATPDRVVGSRKRIEPTLRREPSIGAARPAPAAKVPEPIWKSRSWGKVAAFVVFAGLVYATFFASEDSDSERTLNDASEVKPHAAFNTPLDTGKDFQRPASGDVEVVVAQEDTTEGLSPKSSVVDSGADSGQNGDTTSGAPVLPTPPVPVARESRAPEVKKKDSIKAASAPPPKPVKTSTIKAEKARLQREAELRLAMNLNQNGSSQKPAAPVPVKAVPAPKKKLILPPVTSKPQAPVKVATAPKIKTAPKRSPLDQIKAALLEGQWTSHGKPASLLPSKVTYCNSQGARIACQSAPQDINTKYGAALYKVETILQEFSAGWNFQLSYRTLVKLLSDDSDNTREAALSSDTGWQISDYTMSCQLTQPDRVQCRDKKGVTRDYRRSTPAVMN